MFASSETGVPSGGLVQCSDCHNPHGTGTVRQLRSLPSGDA